MNQKIIDDLTAYHTMIESTLADSIRAITFRQLAVLMTTESQSKREAEAHVCQ